MAESALSPSEVIELKDKGYTNVEIAARLGTSEASVRRALKRGDYTPHMLEPSFVRQANVLLDRPIELSTTELGGVAVTADWHHPLTDYKLVNQFIAEARERRIRNTLLVAGDWFNMDALSAYSPKQKKGADLVTELAYSQETVGTLLETFQRIVITKGNHDWRLIRALGWTLEFKDAMRLLFPDLTPKELGRIEFSNLDHVWVNSPAGRWFIAHPTVYSKRPLTAAIEISAIRNAHVITGHSHHTAAGFARDGIHVVAEIGGFFDVEKTAYLQDTSTFPRWVQGYGFLDKHGHFSLESPAFSYRR